MRFKRSFHHRARYPAAALAFLACSGAVWALGPYGAYGGSYDPATGVLTPDFVTLGGARYSNMQLTVSGIVSGPMGAVANGGDYSYDTASNQLTVPSVTVVGGATMYNVVARVGSLVVPGKVSGADIYDGAYLTIPYVQAGSTVYANVVVTIWRVLRVDGGMPKIARDIYTHYPGGNSLSIGAVQYGSNIYTNVVVTVQKIVSVGAANPEPTLGPGTLSLPCGGSDRQIVCAPASAQLVNTQTTPLNISSIAIDSPDAFMQTNDCPATLGPGQSCAIYVNRKYPVIAPNGTLTVTDDGAGSPRTVALGP